MSKKYSLKTANCMNGYFAITDTFKVIFYDNLFLLKWLTNISLLFILFFLVKFSDELAQLAKADYKQYFECLGELATYICTAQIAGQHVSLLLPAILACLTIVALISNAIYKNDKSKNTGWDRALNKSGTIIAYLFFKFILMMILGGIAGIFTSELNVGVIIIILTQLSLLFSLPIIALEEYSIFNVFYYSITMIWHSLSAVFIFLLSFLGFVVLWVMSLNLTLKMLKEFISFFYSGSLKSLEIIIYLLYGAFLGLVLIISTGFLYYRLKLSKDAISNSIINKK